MDNSESRNFSQPTPSKADRLSEGSSVQFSPFRFLSPYPTSSSSFGVPGSSRKLSQSLRPRISSTQQLQNEVKLQKQQAKAAIEAVILRIIDAIVEKRAPVLEHPRIVSNCRDAKRLRDNPGLTTKIAFGKRGSRSFAIEVHVMSLIYRMIEHNQTSTIRDLYYESMNYFGNQNRLTTAIKKLTFILKVPREALCLEASVKGLVAGAISFRNLSGEVIHAKDFRHGLTIPNKLHELTISTDAKYILFVEKDATFQRLLDENLFNTLGQIILITGKGYPDIQTRRLMRILNNVNKLKVYALVDCDPYGIEIAAVVKWGPYLNSNISNRNDNPYLTSDLSIPDLVWLGLLPSEQTRLALNLTASAQFTERDMRKMESVRERVVFQNHTDWLQEIDLLQQLGQKTELEALFSSAMFTSSVYLPSKLNSLHPPTISFSGGSSARSSAKSSSLSSRNLFGSLVYS